MRINNEIAKLNLEKQINQRYKPSKWEGFKNFIGVFALFIFGIIILFAITYLFVTLIENPISLAILCVTILLIWIWSLK